MKYCAHCSKSLGGKAHFNQIYCPPCAEIYRKKPKHTLTRSQIAEARKLAGTMYAKDLARHIGSSLSNLKRWASVSKISLNAHRYKPSVVKKVTEFYIQHGKHATAKKFPDIRVRSIIERYLAGIKPRKKPLQDDVFIKIAKMAGLVSFNTQARIIDRSNFNSGGVRAAWSKRMNSSGHSLNGLYRQVAMRYVKGSCPFYNPFVHDYNRRAQLQISLWIDMENHLRDDLPNHIVDLFKVMAKFQRWLHGRGYRKNIEKLLRLEFDHVEVGKKR